MRLFSITMIVSVSLVQLASGQTREQKVRNDRAKVEGKGFWIYNDLKSGIQQARRSGKPLLVALRCIPCEQCVKLDEELVEQDPRINPLLEQFVRVRLIATNGMDLSVFQYDYDQSSAVMLMNADLTIYGRYGTRSDHSKWTDDISIEGLARALEGALEIHNDYPDNRDLLAGKQGPKPQFKTPESYPDLRKKFESTLDFEGNVVQSCIHCHQVGDAQRLLVRNSTNSIPDPILFQYPHPKSIGLVMNPLEMATVRQVGRNSLAEQSGFKKGDAIVSMDGQPMLSIADIQWVLHHSQSEDSIPVSLERAGERVQLDLKLTKGWRRQDDISWRVSTWPLRAMVTGGMVTESLDDADRSKMGIAANKMELKVKHVGRYGKHAAALKAGVKVGDIVVSYDGRSDLMRETDLIAHGIQKTRVGEKVQVGLVRKNRTIKVKLPIQD